MEPTAYLESLRPAGSKRSSKRDLIVNVFLRQEGHLTADDLFDLIRREDQRISRATVYRTLQWMVDAGIARKVDFDEGRFRFEHSYRHPRHFHLICKTCNRSFEFLSSDIEALIEEVAAARNFTARQSVLQIHGTCEPCRTGRPAAAEQGATDALIPRRLTDRCHPHHPPPSCCPRFTGPSFRNRYESRWRPPRSAPSPSRPPTLADMPGRRSARA